MFIMENIEDYIKEVDKLDFSIAVIRLQSRLYEVLENIRNRGNKVSATVMSGIKKIHDYIGERSANVSEANAVYRSKLTEMERHNKSYEELAEKISKRSISTPTETVPPNLQRQREEDHSVIVTATSSSDSIDEIKKDIKKLCKSGSAPIPDDVMTTKSGQIILKLKNRGDAEDLQKALMKEEELKSRIKVNVPFKRRERVLILSVDPTVSDDIILSTISKITADIGLNSGAPRNFADKLNDPSLSDSAKKILEEIVANKAKEIRIVRKINTKAGKINWLLDVDNDLKEYLIAKRRICIDLERYRLVEFSPIIRCFKCQGFGHMSNRCKGALHCAKCSAEHLTRDCKSAEIVCANCYFKDPDTGCDHRADSLNCPAYQEYRQNVISSRL